MSEPDQVLELPAVERRRFIGGSDAAAIIGYSRWKTPLRVYFDKRGELPPPSEVDPAIERQWRRGKRMEPIIVDTLIDEYAIKVVKRSLPEKQNRYIDQEHAFLAAELDFEWEVQQADIDRWDLDPALLGTVQNGEAKSVHQFAGAQWGEEETDEIPIEYAAQAMHGQMVRGPDRKLTLFAVMIGVQLVIYFIKRVDETIAGLRKREVSFWYDNVLAGVPPEPVNLPDVLLLFKRDKATEVAATNEVALLVDELLIARTTEAQAKEAAEEVKFKIGKFMVGEAAIERDDEGKVRPVHGALKRGQHVLTLNGQPLLIVTLQTSSRLDTKLLKVRYPEVAAEVQKHSESFVFRRPKEKKR